MKKTTRKQKTKKNKYQTTKTPEKKPIKQTKTKNKTKKNIFTQKKH